jgi:hypothetical protein
VRGPEWAGVAPDSAQVVRAGDGNASICWRSMFASWLVAGVAHRCRYGVGASIPLLNYPPTNKRLNALFYSALAACRT